MECRRNITIGSAGLGDLAPAHSSGPVVSVFRLLYCSVLLFQSGKAGLERWFGGGSRAFLWSTGARILSPISAKSISWPDDVFYCGLSLSVAGNKKLVVVHEDVQNGAAKGQLPCR